MLVYLFFLSYESGGSGGGVFVADRGCVGCYRVASGAGDVYGQDMLYRSRSPSFD